MGRLIPAGTGGMISDLQGIASHRDTLIIEERKKSATVSAQQAIEDLSEETSPAE